MDQREIAALDQQYYLNAFGPRQPVAFTHGAGMQLFGTDGKRYLDFLAGIAVTGLGHSHEAVTQAICAQAGKLLHCSNHYYIEPQAVLAQQLVEKLGAPIGLARAFIGNSGAEANEGAFKLARKYFYKRGEQKYEIISADNSFHGRTLATLAATGQEKYQKPYRPLTPGFKQVPYSDLAALTAAITPATCAIFLETVQGEGGVIPATPEYLAGVTALCKQHELLLILDEIQTGMGRTGALTSAESLGLRPDLLTLAKALGNGVPIGAVLATEEVASALEPGDHGTTFGGNPLACSAALAVMQTMTEPGFLEHVRTTGAYFMKALDSLAAKHPCILCVRGMGLLIGLPLDAALVSAKDINTAMLGRGFLTNATGANVLRFAPPLIVQNGDIDALIAALDEVLP